MATIIPWMGDAIPVDPSGPIMSAISSSACRASCCSAFMAASCSNKASGSRLFTRAPANPASAPARGGSTYRCRDTAVRASSAMWSSTQRV
jgi:hypothetical protein